MVDINLSASLAVRRIIDGDTLSIYFTTNGVRLFQGLSPTDFKPSPSWTESGTHPEITPHVGSARKQSVELASHAWSYNGEDIQFPVGSGWVKSTNFGGRFKLNWSDGTLAIIGDLASETNQDSDVVKYTGKAMVGASSYKMENSKDIVVSMLGSSAYFGGIDATSTILGVLDKSGNEITTSTLKFWLQNNNGDITKFSVKLYRGNEKTPAVTLNEGATGSVTIHRDKTGADDKLYVDSHQLFIAEFIIDGTVVCRNGISIDDAADLFQMSLYGNTSGVDANTDMTVKAQVRNTTKKREAVMGSGSIVFTIYKHEGYVEKRSVTKKFTNDAEFKAASIVVGDSDTKDDNSEFDVLVNANITGSVIS